MELLYSLLNFYNFNFAFKFIYFDFLGEKLFSFIITNLFYQKLVQFNHKIYFEKESLEFLIL